MKKMLLLLAIIMVAMISCDKDEVVKPLEDPNNPANVSIKFNIDVTMAETVMPINHMIVGVLILVQVEVPEVIETQIIRMKVWHVDRTISGDTAKLWLGKTMFVDAWLEVYDNQENRNEYWLINTPKCVEAIVQKQNTFAFTLAVPASYYPKK